MDRQKLREIINEAKRVQSSTAPTKERMNDTVPFHLEKPEDHTLIITDEHI